MMLGTTNIKLMINGYAV